MWIQVTNNGELPIWGVRLLGLSKKDSSKIGRFGTGLKEAIALLIRLGAPPIIWSGETRIEFGVQEDSGEEEICFKLSQPMGRYSSDTWHGLGIHPNFGHHDWTHPWQALREITCNAIDTENFQHGLSDTLPQGSPGKTTVAVPCTPDVHAEYKLLPEKLLVLSETTSLADNVAGALLPKRGNAFAQIFHKGVWVQQAGKPSLFDYDLDLLVLNESRSCDWYVVNQQAAKCLAFAPLAQVQKYLRAALVERQTVYESQLMSSANMFVEASNDTWARAFFSIFGDKAVLCEADTVLRAHVRKAGHVPVCVEGIYGLGELLRTSGVPGRETLVHGSASVMESTREPSADTKDLFARVWQHFQQIGLADGEPPKLRLFAHAAAHGGNVTLGTYHGGTCYINQDFVGSDEEVRILVEEISHHLSGAADETAEFQSFLIEAVARTI